MKLLLFDQNLSPRLVERLADVYLNLFTFFRLGWAMQWTSKFGNMPMTMII